ncbi:hypothetical protein Bhyg_14783 [Pseudolycoriella hygida]|uniref:Uncharacterized protein n=1 Tax=Pseudolycoriella hygida TaxID=35572 RepID=A0A9Q0MSB0_9DIPT|nr:hypothetical protein Bhyg_14783 [Pseudolycoriella hygida]
MSSGNVNENKNCLEELNRGFESLLESIDDVQIKKCLVRKITKEIRLSAFRKLFQIVLFIALVTSLVSVVPFLNWNASAIGRIAMIKVLKLWDWRYVYKVDCLIERNVGAPALQTVDSIEDSCSFCENLEEIRHEWEVSYSDLKANYINRARPVVIEEQQFLSGHFELFDYVETIRNISDLRESNPCNLQTNLVTKSHFTNLNEILELSKNSWDGWFVHFRNCDFSAVKASRALESHPPFLTSQVIPFSSSWILMSKGYNVTKPKKLLLKHLVVVKPIIGSIDVFLEPRSECKESCIDFLLHLQVGCTMVFPAEHWDFFYVLSGQEEAVTFVREYELHL